jgi:hypothetical protein
MFDKTIETETMTVNIQARTWGSSPRPSEMWAKTRVHVWFKDEHYTDQMRALEAAANEVEVDWRAVADGNPEAIAASIESGKRWARFNRAYAKLHVQYATAVLSALEVDFDKVSFSRTAGCSCGCSPASRVDRAIRIDGRPVDIYVTLK